MKHTFNVELLEPGMVLSKNVHNPQTGVILLTANQKLTLKYIEMLKNRGVEEVEVDLDPEQSEKYALKSDVVPTVDRNTAMVAEEAIKKLDDKKSLKNENLQAIVKSASKLVDKILLDSKFIYSLTDYRLHREPSQHSVRVASYAIAVAHKYNQRYEGINLPKDVKEKYQINLEYIAASALLHDVGKLCEDDEVRLGLRGIQNLGPQYKGITPEISKKILIDYDPYYIPVYGFNLIRENSTIPQEVKNIILFSGEDEAELGPIKAPRMQNTRDRQRVAAKIINFCSIFDDYLIENIKEEVTLENAFSGLMELIITRRFSKDMLTDFIETIPLYPIGTRVKLQGGMNCYAKVARNYTDTQNYTRPILLRIPDSHYIDLRSMTDTTIAQIIDPNIEINLDEIEENINHKRK